MDKHVKLMKCEQVDPRVLEKKQAFQVGQEPEKEKELDIH